MGWTRDAMRRRPHELRGVDRSGTKSPSIGSSQPAADRSPRPARRQRRPRRPYSTSAPYSTYGAFVRRARASAIDQGAVHSWGERRMRELALTCPHRWLLLATGRPRCGCGLPILLADGGWCLPQQQVSACMHTSVRTHTSLSPAKLMLPICFTHGFLMLPVCAAITEICRSAGRTNLSSASVARSTQYPRKSCVHIIPLVWNEESIQNRTS
jgi:hypothetical protein